MGQQSSSRLQGDHYQHLYSWYLILDLLDQPQDIDCIWLEHPDAGAADDVTVHPKNPSIQTSRYYQVKWHVDQRSGYSIASLIDSSERSTSLLTKLWQSWNVLRRSGTSEIWLVSNWSASSDDPLGFLIESHGYRLKQDFLMASDRSELGQWREVWKNHLGANGDTFADFYGSLRLRLGFASITDLNEMIDQKMRAVGLKVGDTARAVVIDQVRQWIEEGGTNKKITLSILQEVLDRYELWATPEEEKSIVIALHTWAVRKYDRQPDYELDWSNYFDHETRRIPEPSVWNNTLVPALRDLEKIIREKTDVRLVRLRGSLCLSAAFAFGHIFSTAAGYRIEVQHHDQLWSSDAEPENRWQIDVKEEPGDEDATDALIIVSITDDANTQVSQYARQQRMRFTRTLSITPQGGAHDLSVSGPQHAISLARLIRRELRRVASNYSPEVIHLFYLGPRSLAVFIGQKLNACGTIQLYEFQNPGYTPTCTLR